MSRFPLISLCGILSLALLMGVGDSGSRLGIHVGVKSTLAVESAGNRMSGPNNMEMPMAYDVHSTMNTEAGREHPLADSTLTGPVGGSSGHTLTVAPHLGQYQTINGAMAVAQPGDTVLLQGGTYHEHIVLDKPIQLLGEGNPVIDGGGEGDVLTLAADGCVVTGLEIRNSGRDLSKDQAGIKVKSSHNVLEHNKVVDNLMGIYLFAASDNRVSDNLVQGLKKLPQSLRGNGIHLWNSSRNTIAENELTNNRDALYFSFADDNSITNNLVYGQRVGIHYMYSNHNQLMSNVLHDNINGIAMMNSHDNTLQDNRVFHNNEDGILLKEMDNNVINGNFLYNNKLGLYMYNANHNQLKGNLLAANLIGLNLAAGSDFNVFVGNSWDQNQNQVSLTDPVHNRWDDNGRGNYWSDYTGNDLNNDGIGESVYLQNSLVEYLVGKFPMVKLLFNSPAMQAIDAAERSFPLLNPPGVEDNGPLMNSPVSTEGLSINWHEHFSVSPSEQPELMGM